MLKTIYLLSISILLLILPKGYSQHIFSKTYGHFDYNYGKDILAETDGYFILGNTGLNNGNSAPMLIKTDTAGIIKKFTYQESNDICSASKFIRIGDKLYVCGSKKNTLTNDYDCLLSVYDTSLAFIKTVTYGGSSWDFANKIANTDSLLFITGQTYSTPSGFSWGTISKFNLNGDSLATYYYGSDGEASINSIIVRGDTELVYTGWYQAPDSLYPAAFVTSMALNGTINWSKNLSADLGNSMGNDLTNGNYDRIYICGFTELFSATSKKDAFTYILDASGVKIAHFCYFQPNDDEMTSITTNEIGHLFTASYTKSFGGGGKDLWLLEFDENGYWVGGITMGNQNDEYPEQIRYVPADSSAIICGTSYLGGFSNTSILVVKISKTFQCINNPTHLVRIEDYNQESHFTCYPNPVTNYITINGNGIEKIESVELYDLLGRTLKIYTSAMISNNTIDVSEIVPQLIFLKANTSNKSFTFKLIKQ